MDEIKLIRSSDFYLKIIVNMAQTAVFDFTVFRKIEIYHDMSWRIRCYIVSAILSPNSKIEH